MVSFTLNNREVSVDADPKTPLLWAIRDHVGLTGTKYGCGAGLCGACTIHIDGTAQRACQIEMGSVAGKKVVTIEGLSPGFLASAAESLDRRRSTPVRLLPVRPDHEGGRTPRQEFQAHSRRYHQSFGRQYLSLRDLPPHHSRRRARIERGLES
jgi:2Fe-2S iron-sulfur cluster binding domain